MNPTHPVNTLHTSSSHVISSFTLLSHPPSCPLPPLKEGATTGLNFVNTTDLDYFNAEQKVAYSFISYLIVSYRIVSYQIILNHTSIILYHIVSPLSLPLPAILTLASTNSALTESLTRLTTTYPPPSPPQAEMFRLRGLCRYPLTPLPPTITYISTLLQAEMFRLRGLCHQRLGQGLEAKECFSRSVQVPFHLLPHTSDTPSDTHCLSTLPRTHPLTHPLTLSPPPPPLPPPPLTHIVPCRCPAVVGPRAGCPGATPATRPGNTTSPHPTRLYRRWCVC